MTSAVQAVIHCEIVRQAAQVVAMDQERLRSGDRASVRFRFLQVRVLALCDPVPTLTPRSQRVPTLMTPSLCMPMRSARAHE